MKITVCVKRVPNTGQTTVNSDGTLSNSGAQFILNPYDEYAIEQALLIKDQVPNTTITILSVGPAESESVIREAIAFGADSGILLNDPAFENLDTYHIALVSAKAIEKAGGADLVICGNKAIDSDSWQVPAQIAALLDMSQIVLVKHVLQVDEQGLQASRLTDEGVDKVEGKYPIVLSVLKEIGEPRLPSLKGKMNAKKAQVEKWDKAALGLGEEVNGSEKSFVKMTKYTYPDKRKEGKVLSGEAQQIVEEFVKAVQEDKIL